MEKSTKEKSKKDIKVLFILLLLVMAICGSIGYGVYSYYWAKGEFQMDAQTTIIGSFDTSIATTENEQYYEFVAGGHEGKSLLHCPEELDAHAVNTCYAYLRFKNDGDTNVRVNISNITSTITGDDPNIVWEASEPRLSANDFVIAPDDKYTTRLEIDLTTNSDVISSSEAVETDTSVETDENVELQVEFDISATQELD